MNDLERLLNINRLLLQDSGDEQCMSSVVKVLLDFLRIPSYNLLVGGDSLLTIEELVCSVRQNPKSLSQAVDLVADNIPDVKVSDDVSFVDGILSVHPDCDVIKSIEYAISMRCFGRMTGGTVPMGRALNDLQAFVDLSEPIRLTDTLLDKYTKRAEKYAGYGRTALLMPDWSLTYEWFGVLCWMDYRDISCINVLLPKLGTALFVPVKVTLSAFSEASAKGTLTRWAVKDGEIVV